MPSALKLQFRFRPFSVGLAPAAKGSLRRFLTPCFEPRPGPRRPVDRPTHGAATALAVSRISFLRSDGATNRNPKRNDTNVTSNVKAAAQVARVAFLNCFDARLFSAEVELSAGDDRRLGSALAWLQDAGVLLLPAPGRTEARMTAGEVVEHLRAAVGDHIVDAALAADPARPASREPAPAAVLPVWPFEAEGDDP